MRAPQQMTATATTRRPSARRVLALGASAALVLGAACAAPPTDPVATPTTAGQVDPGAPAGTSGSDGTTGTTVITACRGSGSTPTSDVAYRADDGHDGPELTLDLHRPVVDGSCGPVPLVVYVHGGAFRVGDKDNRIADKVALFTGEGWAFASVNYRLSPDPPDDGPDQIRYPTHVEDVAAAIAWLTEHADENGIDPGRILLIGHSSGAYLVSLLGTDTTFLRGAGVDPPHVRCAVSLDTEYDAAAQVAQGGSQEVLYRNALGNDPATWAAASPITHVADRGPHPRFLIVTQGPARRTDQAVAFAAALEANGTPATAVDVNPLDHEAVNAAVGAPGESVVTPAVVDLFRSCVGAP